MTSGSVSLVLTILICIAVCLTEATSGEGADNTEVLLGSVNNLMEEAKKFNIVTKEAIPAAKRNEKQKRRGRHGVKKQKGKKGKGKRKMQKKIKRNKKGSRKRKKAAKKRVKKQQGKNRKIGKENRKEEKRNGNRRKGRKKAFKKQVRKSRKIGRKGRKNAKGNGRKKSKWQRKQNKNKKLNIKEKKIKRKSNKVADEGCSTAGAAQRISDAIYSYRKYLNHYKIINRTEIALHRLVSKSSLTKLEQYTKALDYLKHVTTGRTTCPGDSNKTANVKEIVEKLTTCGNSTTSPIIIKCNKSQIADHTNLNKQNTCATAYGIWNNKFLICFNKPGSNPPGIIPKTCKCYLDLNNNGDVPNDKPYSCDFPNNGAAYGGDWINNFNTNAKAVVKACNVENKACKTAMTEAEELTSTCCGPTSSGPVTTEGSKRRLKQHALLRNRLQNKFIH